MKNYEEYEIISAEVEEQLIDLPAVCYLPTDAGCTKSPTMVSWNGANVKMFIDG